MMTHKQRKFARDIGSDGYARDAGDAVTLAKKLMENTLSNPY